MVVQEKKRRMTADSKSSRARRGMPGVHQHRGMLTDSVRRSSHEMPIWRIGSPSASPDRFSAECAHRALASLRRTKCAVPGSARWAVRDPVLVDGPGVARTPRAKRMNPLQNGGFEKRLNLPPEPVLFLVRVRPIRSRTPAGFSSTYVTEYMAFGDYMLCWGLLLPSPV